MAELPTGTITFFFTDIEGSTRLLERLGPEAYGRLLEEHAAILREAIETGDGIEVRTEGDAFFAVFETPSGALHAAVRAQRELAAHPWPSDAPIRVRMGFHTGEGRRGGDDYVGMDVHRAARIAAAAHGGQVLLSDASRGLLEHAARDEVRFRGLGRHRLKDLPDPEPLAELVIEGLPSRFPPPRSLDARPNNLPLSLTAFVGRREELERCAGLLSQHRVVTLTGPAGTGKTRLALEAATKALPSFRDGTFLVELAPIGEATLVAPVIAKVLDVKEEPGRELIDTLVDHLADKEVLLVLDNLEHLLDATPVVERVLASAPRLRILATSRAPLGLYGEQEQEVPPLALPRLDAPVDAGSLSEYEAVRLFLDRARAAKPSLEVTDEETRTIAEICSELDGLPLAIELAASRVKVLSPRGIKHRLGDKLGLLTASARNLPARQRTLRSAIEWSYDLLEEPDRRLYARFSVFKGGGDLDAIEAVCMPMGGDALDAVTSLVDRSLVRRIEARDAEPRFGMLETIRSYAGERLREEFDLEATRRRHAEHFLGLAMDLGRHVEGGDFTEWLARFDREHDNLLEALRWAAQEEEADQGMLAAASLWRFWQLRGHYAVGRTRLERLLELDNGGEARARAHEAAGNLAYWQSDTEEAERHYRRSLEIFRELGDDRSVAQVTYDLGFLPYARGEPLDASLPLFREALALYERVGDEDGIAKATGYIGFVLLMKHEPEEALPLLERFLIRSRERGDFVSLIEQTVVVSAAHVMLGDMPEARRSALEALDFAEDAGIAIAIAGVLYTMAALESRDGRHQRAARLTGAAEAIQGSAGGSEPPFFVGDLLGDPVAAARSAIGAGAADQALDEGRTMSVDEALAYVREGGTSPPTEPGSRDDAAGGGSGAMS